MIQCGNGGHAAVYQGSGRGMLGWECFYTGENGDFFRRVKVSMRMWGFFVVVVVRPREYRTNVFRIRFGIFEFLCQSGASRERSAVMHCSLLSCCCCVCVWQGAVCLQC